MKIIIILTLILITIDVIHTLIDPMLAMCIDGEINTAFNTEDGNTYIFMDSWFWKLSPDLSKAVGNASEIPIFWKNLPKSIETSFYVSGNKTNILNGNTFFIKSNKWFRFKNQEFISMGNTDNWTEFPTGGDILAVAQYNDPIIVFYRKHYKSFRPKAYYFDSPYFPEEKTVIVFKLPFEVSDVEAVVAYSHNKFLLFFDDKRVGEHCILDSQSRCVTRLNADFFDCPDYTKNLFEGNIFIRIWFWTGLGLKQFGILVLGILLSLSLIFIFLLLVFGLKVKKQFNEKFKNK